MQIDHDAGRHDVYAQRLRRVTEEYLYRVRLIAFAQARSDTVALPRNDQERRKPNAA